MCTNSPTGHHLLLRIKGPRDDSLQKLIRWKVELWSRFAARGRKGGNRGEGSGNLKYCGPTGRQVPQ